MLYYDQIDTVCNRVLGIGLVVHVMQRIVHVVNFISGSFEICMYVCERVQTQQFPFRVLECFLEGALGHYGLMVL